MIKIEELEKRLNEGINKNYNRYRVEQCSNNKTEITYFAPYYTKYYALNTDNIDDVVKIFKSNEKEKYCTYTKSYDCD